MQRSVVSLQRQRRGHTVAQGIALGLPARCETGLKARDKLLSKTLVSGFQP